MSDIVRELSELSSAEDIFAALDVPFDPKVLGIARLHILKRMGDVLSRAEHAVLSEADRRAFLQASLATAYDEFSGKAPIGARLFKVLRDRDPTAPKSRAAFVPLSQLVGEGA